MNNFADQGRYFKWQERQHPKKLACGLMVLCNELLIHEESPPPRGGLQPGELEL